jgi:FkbM family methyltransferase
MAPAAETRQGGLELYIPLGGTVIDIGANVGHFTKIYAGAVGPTGRVIALEPNPVTCEQLTAACATLPHVSVRCAAVASGIGTRTLYVGKQSAQASLWRENVPPKETPSPVEVETVTLDAVCRGLREVHGVKIDAQGSEMAILFGGLETLQRPETVWMIEVWPDGLLAAGSSVEALVDMLQGAGLQVIAEGKVPIPRVTLTWSDILKTRRGGHHHTNIVCRH